MTVQNVVVLLAVVVAIYGLLLISAAREGIRWQLGRLIAAAVGSFGCYSMLTEGMRFPRNEAAIVASVVFALFMAIARKRSRHIPAAVRRRVIARDLKGKAIDPKTQHLDHRMPFARGGSHTADNLRVVDKKKNLRKGKKLPRPTDWF